MFRTRSLVAIAAAFLLTVTLGAWLPTTAAGDRGPCRAGASTAVEQITLTEVGVEISGTVGRTCSRMLDLYRFEQWEELDVEASEPVASVRADRHGRFTGEVDRYVDGRDGAYARYLAVARGGNTILDGPRYVENIEAMPEFASERLQPDTRKGLAVTMTSDAEAVGAGQAAISVAINNLLLPQEPAEGGLSFESNGKTYWFDASTVEWLDHMIKPMSDRGVAVYLVLVLIHGDEDSSFPLLAHPDAPGGTPTSFMTYGFDTVTEEGVSAFTAVMEFIAERYSRDDERYGRSLDYVIGNEINSAGVWHQVGEKSLEDFVATYTPALRIGWQAAQKYSASARVFTSLDHFWTDAADPNHPEQFYPGRDVLDELASLTAAEGDFPWNVAQHPYPSDMLDPRVWDDPVTLDPDTPKVTFKNLPVLSDHLQRPELLFEGEQRRIILSELGCQSPSDSAEDLELQAACMAYAYYASVGVPGVDAFLWDPQVDNRAAGGLRMGLWTWDPAREDFPAAPGERKPSYDLFAALDTPESLEATEFALDVIGADYWSELIPWFEEAQLDGREPTSTQPLVRDADLSGTTVVEGFEGDAPGWTWADHVATIAPSERADATEGEQVLQLGFEDPDVVQSNGRNSKVWRGAAWQPEEPLDLSGTPVLGLDVRVPEQAQADLAANERLSVRLLLHGSDGTSIEGTASVDADAWTSVDLDTSEWEGRDAVTSVTVWVSASSGVDWLGTAEIDRVRTSETLTEVAPTLSVTARAGTDYPDGEIEIVVTNHGREPLPGNLIEVVCDGIVTEVGDLDVAGLEGAGGTDTFTTLMAEFSPADPRLAQLCYELDGEAITVFIEAPKMPSLLFDFEDGTQGWEAGQNVTRVDQVSGFPNGPFVPRSGSGALQGTMADALASEPRSVFIEPSEPIVLGEGAEELYAWVDGYGGVPDATSYEATLTVRSGEHELTTVEENFRPDSWNRLAVDVSDWPYRTNITRIEVTYRVPGSENMWRFGPLMQVDDVGVTGEVDTRGAWTAAWGASLGGPTGSSTDPDSTRRQSVTVTASGEAARLRFSNPTGTDLRLDAVSVGVRSGDAPSTVADPVAVTLGGDPTVVIPAGETIYTDPVALAIRAGDRLLVSSHASEPLPLVTHDFALTTAFTAPGDQTMSSDGTGFTPAGTSWAWLDGVDVLSSHEHGAVVAIGDSNTDGAGSGLDADQRWTDVLAQRFQELDNRDDGRRSVVNAGIGGNTLSSYGDDLVGPNGLLRLERDVLSHTGASTVVVAHGSNDIYMGSSVEQVRYALTKTAQRIKDAGLSAVIATATPRGNGTGWTDAKEERRLELNAWIREQDVFDAVIDFDAVIADPADPSVIAAEYDADGTHPNAAGYAAMGQAIDLADLTGEPGPLPERLQVISDFEVDEQGWVAGDGVTGVEQVGSFPNGPTRPLEGVGVLQGALEAGPATEPRTVMTTLAEPLDLSGASEVYAWIDAYGGLGAPAYVAEITVSSGDDSISGTLPQMRTDSWNRVAVDISGWVGRSNVTGIAVTYRVVGTEASWTSALMQIDEVGAVVPVQAPPQTVVLEGFEDGTGGWSAGDGVNDVAAVTGFPNGPHVPYAGRYALEARMTPGPVSNPKTVVWTAESPLDISGADELGIWFDGYGGIPDASGYQVDLTVCTGEDCRTGTLSDYRSDSWQRVAVDVAGWEGAAEVTHISVTYRILESAWVWQGVALFQLDDLHTVEPPA